MRSTRFLSVLFTGLLATAVASPAPPALAQLAETALPAASAAPPPGGVIAFSAYPGDGGPDAQVFVINADGTGERQLTHVPEGTGAGEPDISPDGSTIVYASNEAGGSFALYAMAADGSDQHQLLGVPGYDFGLPRYSPDGSRLVAQRCDSRTGLTVECDLVLLNADGTGVQTLLSNQRNQYDPAWSPDGSTMAFASDQAGLLEAVYTMPAGGGPQKRITKPPLEAFWPDWAPDGQHLLVSSYCCRRGSDVYRIRPDGSGLTKLTRVGDHDAAFARYSPDGRGIVFFSDVGRPPDSGGDLYTMRANGRGVRLLVDDHPGVLFSDWGVSPASATSGRGE